MTKVSIALFALAACTGEIDDLPLAADRPIDPPDCEARGDCPIVRPAECEGTCVGESGLTRLTRAQYRNAVRDLLGDVEVDLDSLPVDYTAAGLFASNESVAVVDTDVEAYAAAAEDAAAQASIDDLLDCATRDDACMTDFVDAFVSRAYRRPLTDGDRSAYAALATEALAAGDSFEEAWTLVVATALQAPSFIYRVENAIDGVPTRLSGHEVATRLAFALWDTTPDPALLDAAASGRLDDAAGIEAETRRMLEDTRADRAIRAFHRQWLRVGDVASLTREDPAFTDIGGELLRETESFAVDVFRNDARLETLLSAPYTIATPALATYYGSTLETTGRLELGDRAGILMHGSVLATHAEEGYTSPIRRGLFVRTLVLCQSIAPPPAGLDEEIARREGSIGEDASDRERLTSLTSGVCATCHNLTNEVGYAFNEFDATGRFRATDAGGRSIDATGTLDSFGSPQHATDADGAFEGALDLVRRLAASESVASCVSRQWTRFLLGREVAIEDATSLAAAEAAFAESNHDLRELIVAIATSDAFAHRLPPPE